jgi:hypothetical protein
MTEYSSSTGAALQGQELRDDELDAVSGGWCELGGLTGTPTTGAGVFVDALKINLSQVRGPTKNP